MNELVTLREIEVRIHEHMTATVRHMIMVGKELNEAKARKLVPHGKWESWVREHTGFSERQAQRLMQAADQVDEGSAMMRLDMSKVSMILALPADQRESIAEKADRNDMTVRELEKEIRLLHARNAALETGAKNRDIAMQQIRGNIDKLNDERAAAESRAAALQLQLDEMMSRPPQVVQDPEQQRTIEALRDEIAELEAHCEEQSRQRAAAQQELLNRDVGAHDSGDELRTTIGDIIRACGTFMGKASVLAHMPMGNLSDGDRAELDMRIDMIEKWCRDVRGAMNVVYIDSYASRR